MSKNNDRTKHLKPFKPGQSGNPGGRPKLTEEEKEMRALTRKQIIELASVMVKLTPEQISDLMAGPGVSALQMAFGKMILNMAENGDVGTMSFILNRTIGPVPTDIDLNVRTRPVISEIMRQDGSGIRIAPMDGDGEE